MQNGDAPATRKDLDELEARIRELIEKTETGVKELIEKNETGFKALLEKTETTLLTEFWKWARINDIKVRSVTHHTNDIDERFSLLEERVADLERRRPLS